MSDMRRLRLAEVVVAQAPAGVRASDATETARAGKRLRSTAAASAAPSTEVRNETMQVEVESRIRAAGTVVEDSDPRMEGHELLMTMCAAGEVSAGHE